MKRGRQGDHLRKHGLFAGWDEYRNGARPVSVAPVFNSDKRKHVVDRMLDIMRDWRETPFETEGPLRAALRSALCLEGHGWPRSDAEAASVVAQCLSILGAKRPDWEEGQREYTVSPDQCSRCQGPIPTEFLISQRKTRFCSDVCARAALADRDFRIRHHSDQAYAAAHDVIARSRNPPKPCRQCGRPFRTRHATNASLYCSPVCSGLASRVAPTVRQCVQCGKAFELKNGDEAFCSRECYWKADRPKITAECIWCHRAFEAKGKKAKFCGNTCSTYYYNMKLGRAIPRRLSPPVFDYVFRMAA